MNILEKLPTKFIQEFITKGGHITIAVDCDKVPYLDLNTGMKSHLHLYYEEVTGYIAKARYDTAYCIETFYDLHKAILECDCGRSFISGSIEKIYKEGFDNEFDKFE